MPKKLWGGRFTKRTNPLVEEFTKSIDYDYKLAKYDVFGTMIHVSMLEKSGFISKEELMILERALGKIYNKIEKGAFKFDRRCEDIHTNIQNALEKKVGELVLKLHTARSRNDQVLFDLKLFCKFELLKVEAFCQDLRFALLDACKKAQKTIIPGYTHLQHAQLVYLSDYLKSYIEMLKRDSANLEHIRKKIKLSLGAGAFAGTPIKAEYYRESIKQFIRDQKTFVETFNVEEEITVPKALDTVSDRDFVIEILSALSILGMHLSRFSEEIVIWATKEFNFVELDDAFATGSSLMPQKKNPDVLELIRGYTGTLYGNLFNVLTIMKGLPLTYNRDMQLDKPPLFSSLEIVTNELRVLTKLVRTLKWNRKAIALSIEENETLYATDLVYYLIRKGIPFKSAHDIIGKLIEYSLRTGKKIREIDDKKLKRFSDQLKHKGILEVMDPVRSVESRISIDRSKPKTLPKRKAKPVKQKRGKSGGEKPKAKKTKQAGTEKHEVKKPKVQKKHKEKSKKTAPKIKSGSRKDKPKQIKPREAVKAKTEAKPKAKPKAKLKAKPKAEAKPKAKPKKTKARKPEKKKVQRKKTAKKKETKISPEARKTRGEKVIIIGTLKPLNEAKKEQKPAATSKAKKK